MAHIAFHVRDRRARDALATRVSSTSALGKTVGDWQWGQRCPQMSLILSTGRR
jgi:hypothetical protein